MLIAILSETYISVQSKHESVGKHGLSRIEMDLLVNDFVQEVS